MSYNAIINVYKTLGMTSFDVIRHLRKILKEKKIGHIGTLDPFAEGVLPVFTGKMTNLINYINQIDKTYHAVIQLGLKSNTLDIEGDLEKVPLPSFLNDKIIKEVILNFQGSIQQTPPMYSAIKVKGKPLYSYARKGEILERQHRTITIHWIKNITIQSNFEISFDVKCSKGTYIRVLAEDIGHHLQTEACVTKLIRTACGDFFNLNNAFTLDQILNLNQINEENSCKITPQQLFSDFYLVQVCDEKMLLKIQQGQSIFLPIHYLKKTSLSSNYALIENIDKKIIAIGNLEFSQDSYLFFQPKKMLR